MVRLKYVYLVNGYEMVDKSENMAHDDNLEIKVKDWKVHGYIGVFHECELDACIDALQRAVLEENKPFRDKMRNNE
jgi:hypothetical protein